MSKRKLSMLFVLCSLQISVPAWSDPNGEVVVTVESAANEQRVVGARVTLTETKNASPSQTLVSDSKGVVDFKNVEPGDYVVEITGDKFEPDRTQLHVVAGLPARYLSLLDVPGGEKVIKVSDRRSLINNTDPSGGNKIDSSSTFINTQITDGRNLQSVLNTAPGMQSDANGQVHIRGEHKSLVYSFDGLTVPNGLSSNYAQLVDPRFFDDISIKLGNYDSSQFGQLGAVVDFKNEVGKVTPYIEYSQAVGDHHFLEELFKAGGSNNAGTFDYFVGARMSGTNLRTEPQQPYAQDINNTGRDDNYMVRLHGKPSDNDVLGFTYIHQDSALGVPIDLNSYNAGVRQNQYDHNDLATFAWDHKFDKDDALKLGFVYSSNNERYTNNGVYTPFTVVPASVSPDLNAQGAPADPTSPGSPYLPTSDTQIKQYQGQIEYKHDFANKAEIKIGGNADFISSSQQVNVIDAGGGGSLPGGASVFNADAVRNGFFGGIFFSESLPITDTLSLNYGARVDHFNNGAGLSTGQISPRVNLLWAPDDHSALRVSYNSLFQPPPLEIDVSGLTTALPQRTDQYEINYQREAAKDVVFSLGYVYKNFKNQLDVGLLIPNSQVPIFAPLNFDRAFYNGVEFTLNTKFKQGLNGFLSGTYGTAKPTAGSLTEGTDLPAYNDHDQRFQLTGGVSESWSHGWSAETDFLFGTGFPQDTLAGYNAVGITPYGLDPNGGRLAHFYTNFSIGYSPTNPDGSPKTGFGARLQVYNLFNNTSDINFLSGFSGTRFSLGRRVVLNTTYRF